MAAPAPSARELRRALDIITLGARAFATESLALAAEAVRRDQRPWMRERSVQGYGIGRATTDGATRPELALKLYVDRKLPEGLLDNPAPAHVAVPGAAKRIPVDVEAIGTIRHEANTDRRRPGVPGCSIGHAADTDAGTLGCLVRKRNAVFSLSNAHVLARGGTGAVGDAIIQPGAFDRGTTPADTIATLEAWVPFVFSGRYDNLVDAAIARVRTRDVTSRIRKIGAPKGVTRTVRRGAQVQKTGRTTDYTIGRVLDTDFRFHLTYPKPGGGRGAVGFRDQVLCTRYTSPGDSGAAVLTMTGNVVGLHFAGSESASIFSPIRFALDALGVELVTEEF